MKKSLIASTAQKLTYSYAYLTFCVLSALQ